MNALRNILYSSTRTISYIRQNGQNALFNLTQQPVDGIATANFENSNAIAADQLQALSARPTIIPKSILDATAFKGKAFSGNGGTTTSLSPTTFKRLRRMHQKVQVQFLCKICKTRNTKEVSEAAYKNGIVILQCDSCNVENLICDNLGWFADTKGKDLDFDQVLAARAGERRVKVVKINEHGELI